MRWFWLALFAFLIATGAFLPQILSTEWGKEFVVSRVNGGIRGHLDIQKIQLSWRGPQKAEGLQLKDPQGRKIATVQSLSTDTSLFTLLFHRNTFGATTVIQPTLALERDEAGISNLEKSLSQAQKKGKRTGWPRLTGKLVVKDGQMHMSAPKIEEISISDAFLEYSPDQKLFHLTAKTKEGAVTGEILASGSLGEKRHILARIDNFPVAILDQLSNSKLYTHMVGEKINVKIESTNREITAEVQSQLLNGRVTGSVKDRVFVIDSEQSALKFVVTPAFFQELVSEDLKKQWQLADRTTLTFDITKGEIPLSLDWAKSDIEAKVHLERAELLHANQGHYSLNNFEGSLVAKDGVDLKVAGQIVGKESSKLEAEIKFHEGAVSFSADSDGFPFSLLELAFEEAKALNRFFGDRVAIKVRGDYSPSKGLDSTFDLSSFMTNVQGDVKGKELGDLTFDIHGTRRFTGGLKDALGEGTTFAFKGKAEMVKRILSVSTFTGRIDSDVITTEVKGQLGKKGTPFSFEHMKVVGDGKLLNLPINKHYEDAKLKEGSFSFVMDGAKNSLIAKTRTSFEAEGKREIVGDLKISGFIVDNNLDTSAASIDFDGHLDHFPTGVLDLFTPEHVDLTTLIGPTVTLKTKLHYNPKKEIRFQLDLDAKAPGFSADLAIAVDPTFRITQSQPGHIHWEITDKRYEALAKLLSKEGKTAYELQNRSALDIEIDKIYCPKEFPENVKTFVCRSGVVGKIKVEPMLFSDTKTQDRFALQKIEGSIFGENFSRKIHMDLQGELFSSKLANRAQGEFTVEVDLLNLWSEEPLAVNGEVDLSHIPVRQVLGIIPLDPIFRQKAQALMGDSLDANISAQVSKGEGPITVDISASNFKALFPLQLAQDRILLRDVLKAEITFTDAVSEHFITDINPMIVKGARSDHPIRVFVDPEGFSFPLPWSFKELVIEKAVVDIGKIYVKNGGAVEELMKFLKAKPPKDKLMRAWFTPVFLSLKNGVLRHERFDILLHKNVHIALWGRVDLIKQKVWMTLGIAPQTLKQRFNILGISKKDMFQVKMRGKTSHVELDWSSAYTRIGILIARLAGGPPGYIVGGILEQVISALGEEPTPPPTVHPFPWDVKQQKNEEAPEVKTPPSSAQQKANRKLMEFIIP